MKHSQSSDAHTYTANPEIPHTLCKPDIHCHIHNSPHSSLPSATSNHSTPSHPIPFTSILIILSRPRLGLPSTKFFPHSYHMPCPSDSPLFVDENLSWSSSLRNFLPSPVTCSTTGPNYSLSTLLSNTLSPRSSHNVTPSFAPIQNKHTHS